MINNAILASVAAGRPVMVNSHTSDDYKGRLPRFWAAEGPYRPTPAGLGTYGFNYPPHYTPRERAISLGNVTETLMQVLRVRVADSLSRANEETPSVPLCLFAKPETACASPGASSPRDSATRRM